MELPKISKEQNWIVKRIKQGYNVVVDSVAGSGKTTTNLFIAHRFPKKNILLLTYNAKLRLETRSKAKKLELLNIEVHTYHSFIVKNYDRCGFTDTNIIRFLVDKGTNPPFAPFSYDIVILDEAQDMTPIYFEIITKLLKDNSSPSFPLICVLGDRQQSIYAFNKADERFIIHTPKIFSFSPYPWKKRDLSYSFRLTSPMISFLNDCVLSTERLKSEKKGVKPTYIYTNAFSEDTSSPQYAELFKLLESEKYQPQDIFVLAPSIRKPIYPVRRFANQISKLGIDIFVPVSDEETIDETIIENKILFSTFHQAKGMERKVVFVFGFDSSYFRYFCRDKSQLKCPNELYVATTRAKERLFLIHDTANGTLPFINPEKIRRYCEVINIYNRTIQNHGVEIAEDKSRDISVSDLIRYIPADAIVQCLEYLEIKKIKNPTKKIKVQTKIKQKVSKKRKDGKIIEQFEGVSEINGIAIPAYYEYITTNSSSISEEKLDEIPTLLEEANKFCALTSGYTYKLRQINDYNWLKKDDLDRCMKRIEKLKMGKTCDYERRFQVYEKPELFSNSLFGYVDCIAYNVSENGKEKEQNIVYEFKCTSSIDETHIIQLALYAYLISMGYGKKISSYRLFNILTSEMLEIKFQLSKLVKIVELLVSIKQGNGMMEDKIKFIKKQKETRKKYGF